MRPLLPLTLLAACSLPSDFDQRLADAVAQGADTDAASTTDLTDAIARITALEQKVTSLESENQALRTDLTTLQGTVSTLDSDHDARLTDLEDADGLPSDLLRDADIGTRIPSQATFDTLDDTVTATTTGLVDRVGALESTVATHDEAIYEADGGLQDLLQETRTDLLQLDTAVDQLTTALAAVYTKTEADDRFAEDTDVTGLAADVYTKSESESRFLQSSDLAPYALTVDVYDKATADGRFLQSSDLTPYALAENVYDKTAADGRFLQSSDLTPYALAENVYDKTAADGRYVQPADLTSYATDTDIGGLSSRLDGVDGTLGALDGELNDLMAAAVLVVDGDITISVAPSGGDFTDVRDALASLDMWRIPTDAIVTIEMASGLYTFTEPLRLTHPDGDRIHLVGATGSADDVILRWSGDTDGIVVSQGGTLGMLDHITLDGDRDVSVNRSAVLATYGGHIRLGPDVEILEWDWGLYADWMGGIWSPVDTPGLWIHHCDQGILARGEGTVLAYAASITDIVGKGVEASYFGTANVRDVMITNTGSTAVYANLFGRVRAYGAQITTAGFDAVVASDGGQIDAEFATITGTSGRGMFANSAGIITARGTDVDGATEAFSATNRSALFVGSGSAANTSTCLRANQHGYVNGGGITCAASVDLGVFTRSMSYVFREDWTNATTTSSNTLDGDLIDAETSDNAYIE